MRMPVCLKHTVGLKVRGVVPRSVRVCLCQAVVGGTVLAPGKGVRSTFLLQAQLDPGTLLRSSPTLCLLGNPLPSHSLAVSARTVPSP